MSKDRRELSVDECRVRLGQARIGRISVTKGALPVIVPVRFDLDDHGLVFHIRSGSWLARACDRSVVAFEADQLLDSGEIAWSVHVLGIASLGSPSAPLKDLDVPVSVAIQRISGYEISSVPVAAIAG